MGRAPCCDKKESVKKGPWTPDEDLKLVTYIKQNGHGSWRALPQKAGLARCGKSCRLRWTNYLRPDIKRGRFSHEEEQIIFQLHAILGNRWSAIARRLPRRTDNEIKNHWNTHLKKRAFTQKGTHDLFLTPKIPTRDAEALQLTPSWRPRPSLTPTRLTHTTQWDLTVRLWTTRMAADPPLLHQTNPGPSDPGHYMGCGSWAQSFSDFSTSLHNCAMMRAAREGHVDTLRAEYCVPAMESHSIPTSQSEAATALRPDTVLGDACMGPCTVVGSSCNCDDGVSTGEGLGSVMDGPRNPISPPSILRRPDRDHTYADISPYGSTSGSDCFDLILHHGGKLFLDGEEEGSEPPPAAGTFWEHQLQAALFDALKPDGTPDASLLLLQGSDAAGIYAADAHHGESGLRESIISMALDFDGAEFPQFESLYSVDQS